MSIQGIHKRRGGDTSHSGDTRESDIDIVCTYQDQEAFIEEFESAYSGYESYSMRRRQDHALGRFHCDQFLLEVYASETPVQLQAAFRHYQVMKRPVKTGGNEFIDRVRQLKENGLKTEPAICRVMGQAPLSSPGKAMAETNSQ